MQDSQKPSPAQQAIVMWIIWFAILAGIFIIRIFAAPERIEEEVPQALELSVIGMIGLAAAVGGLITRLFIVPRTKEALAQFRAMIIGLALCEGCGIIGMFAAPNAAEGNLMFVVAVVSLVVSAPIYARPKPIPSPFHQS